MNSTEESFPNGVGRALPILPIRKEVTERRLYKGDNNLISKNEKKFNTSA